MMQNPLIGTWWLWRLDGEPFGENWTVAHAGTDDDPEWEWADEDWENGWYAEPVMWVAARFEPVDGWTAALTQGDVRGYFRMEMRTKTFVPEPDEADDYVPAHELVRSHIERRPRQEED